MMLVLRRKIGERVVLGGVIDVCVLAIEGERVKLGVSAPREISILRGELLPHASDAVTDEDRREEE